MPVNKLLGYLKIGRFNSQSFGPCKGARPNYVCVSMRDHPWICIFIVKHHLHMSIGYFHEYESIFKLYFPVQVNRNNLLNSKSLQNRWKVIKTTNPRLNPRMQFENNLCRFKSSLLTFYDRPRANPVKEVGKFEFCHRRSITRTKPSVAERVRRRESCTSSVWDLNLDPNLNLIIVSNPPAALRFLKLSLFYETFHTLLFDRSRHKGRHFHFNSTAPVHSRISLLRNLLVRKKYTSSEVE